MEKDDYHKTVSRFEQSAPWCDILAPPLVVTHEEWQRYAESLRPEGDGADAIGLTRHVGGESD